MAMGRPVERAMAQSPSGSPWSTGGREDAFSAAVGIPRQILVGHDDDVPLAVGVSEPVQHECGGEPERRPRTGRYGSSSRSSSHSMRLMTEEYSVRTEVVYDGPRGFLRAGKGGDQVPVGRFPL